MPHGAAGCKATPSLGEQNGSWGCSTPTISQSGERGSCPSSTIHRASLVRAILAGFGRNASGRAGTDRCWGGSLRRWVQSAAGRSSSVGAPGPSCHSTDGGRQSFPNHKEVPGTMASVRRALGTQCEPQEGGTGAETPTTTDRVLPSAEQRARSGELGHGMYVLHLSASLLSPPGAFGVEASLSALRRLPGEPLALTEAATSPFLSI